MSSSGPEANPRAVRLSVDDRELMVELSDGRRISAPTAWFPRLAAATPRERENWRFVGDGEGLHWPDIDEDISVRGLLHGLGDSDGSKRVG